MSDISTLIATVLGGVNLIQFVYIRQLVREKTASADVAETKAERERMSLHHDGTNQMIQEIDTMRERLVELNRKTIDYLDEISDLKTKVIYLNSLSCLREDCPRRMRKSDEKCEGLDKRIDRC